MPVDADLQVWLDQAAARGQVVAPYVRTALPVDVDFQLRVIREGQGGRAETRQQGLVRTVAGNATALGTVSVNAGPADRCDVELRVRVAGRNEKVYRFDCPVSKVGQS